MTDKTEDNQATTIQNTAQETSESESEPDSPKKTNRAARVGASMLPSMARRAALTGLNSKLSNMSDKERDIWGEEVFKALKARTAKADDSPEKYYDKIIEIIEDLEK